MTITGPHTGQCRNRLDPSRHEQNYAAESVRRQHCFSYEYAEGTCPSKRRRGYLINQTIGVGCLLAAAVGHVLESLYPNLKASLSFGFLFTAVACLYAASISHAKYVSLNK